MVNSALRDQNRTSVVPWRHYIWLLLNALHALPQIRTDIVYRGIKLPLKELGRNYQKGAVFQTHGFTSTTNDIEVRGKSNKLESSCDSCKSSWE
jgi:hypothetical protein